MIVLLGALIESENRYACAKLFIKFAWIYFTGKTGYYLNF